MSPQSTMEIKKRERKREKRIKKPGPFGPRCKNTKSMQAKF